MKTSKGYILAFLIMVLFMNGEITHASTDTEQSESVQVFPYEKTFTITAYYSPIPGQEKYIRGSLEADKHLNGNGTNGADGTSVFPGMIAAPKSIPFGTKMNVPGIGTVSVHDRGGAIVPAGQRGHMHDRLDIWMGSGDEGLNRALRWGKRDIKVIVYGIDSSIEENVDLSRISGKINSGGNSTSSQPSVYQKSYGYGDQSEEIKKIKENLASLGFYEGKINNNFDQNLYEAVVKLQIQQGVVNGKNEFGAGYFGPQTRKALARAGHPTKTRIIKVAQAEELTDTESENIQYAGNGLSFLETDLKTGDSGQTVIELQTELKKLNLFGLEPTGYYGNVTAHAVFKFQQSQGLVENKESNGAGIFGHITRSKLSNLVHSRIETRRIIAEKPRKK